MSPLASPVPHLNVQTKVEAITPEMASQLLGTMAGNRSLRKRYVSRYAREMIAGKWEVNGEAIKISRSGRLIDGQHRLQAVIEANCAVWMCVTRGVEDGAIVTLDTGVGRSYIDANTIRGREYSNNVAPVARLFYRYEQGSPTVNYTPTHQELDDIIDRHPSIPYSARFVTGLEVIRRRCVPSVQGFMHAYITEMWDQDTADLYIHTLNDGTNMTKDNPLFLLRRKLVDEDSTRLETPRVLALSIKAFNAWIREKPMAQLSWATGGKKPEPFPRFLKDITPKALTAIEESRQRTIDRNKSEENRRRVAETNRKRRKVKK